LIPEYVSEGYKSSWQEEEFCPLLFSSLGTVFFSLLADESSMAATFPMQAGGEKAVLPFSLALQPIINVTTGTAFSYEALVRGPQGQSAASIFSRLKEEDLLAFDQCCRTRAMTLAGNLGILKTDACLSINFLPRVIRTPSLCSEMTVTTAQTLNFPLERVIFEVAESERVLQQDKLHEVAMEYRKRGFRIAITADDLSYIHSRKITRDTLHADILKLDMAITRNLNQRPRAQTMLASLRAACAAEGIELIAEGVENTEEYMTLLRCGVTLMQGYLFAMPAFESLPSFELPTMPSDA